MVVPPQTHTCAFLVPVIASLGEFLSAFMVFVSVFHSITCLRSGKVIGCECQLELVGANPVLGLLGVHMVAELGCPGLHLCWVFSVHIEVVKAQKYTRFKFYVPDCRGVQVSSSGD